MEFGQTRNQFIRCFYFLGLSCYPRFDGFPLGKSTNRERFSRYIPTGGLITFNLIISISFFLFKFINHPNVLSDKHIFIIVINILTPTLTVIVCAIRMPFLGPQFAELWSLMNIIERSSWHKTLFDSRAFKRRIFRKVAIIALLFMLPIMYTISFHDLYQISYIGTVILKLVVLLVLMQPFFYIELFDYMLECFARHIMEHDASAAAVSVESIIVDSTSAHHLKIKMTQFKLVHFHMWSILQKINELFGWTIIVILLYYFIYMIFSVSLALQYLYLGGGLLKKVPRKWTWCRQLFLFDVLNSTQFVGPFMNILSVATIVTIFLNSCHRCRYRVILKFQSEYTKMLTIWNGSLLERDSIWSWA